MLKIYDSCDQNTAVDFADEVDIRHVYIRPMTPRLNGKVERSHRADNEEFYRLLDKGGVSDDIHLQQEAARGENYDNHHRTHGGLGGKTHFERFLERTKVSPKSLLPTLSPSSAGHARPLTNRE